MSADKSDIFDIAIIGGGIAGCCAALRASQLGAKVILFEKGTDVHYPCNTRYSGGLLHLCKNYMSNPPEKIEGFIADTTSATVEPELASAMANDAARTIEWLREQGIRFIRAPVDWSAIAIAPPRPPKTGVLWGEGRGGDLLLTTLAGHFKKLGAQMRLGAEVTNIALDNDAVKLTVKTSGESADISARAAIIADGGYQASTALISKHIGASAAKAYQRNAGSGTGDGLRMATAVGAGAKGLQYGFYGHLLSQDVFTNSDLSPFPTVDDVVCLGVVVTRDGRRFADEGLGGIHMANVLAKSDHPLDATGIFDQAMWDSRHLTVGVACNPWLEHGGGKVIRASSLRELAGQLGIDPDRLETTVTEHNDAVEKGRGAELSPARSFIGQPRKIEKAPYGAIKLLPGITYTYGGISIDQHGRVRTPEGAIIPRLYAAGATTGGLEGGPHHGYVGGLSKAAIFGLRTAEHIGTHILGLT